MAAEAIAMKKSRARPRRPAPRPLELSAGAQPGDVRLTAFADARVFIENHSGIIEFDDAPTLIYGGRGMDGCSYILFRVWIVSFRARHTLRRA